MTNPRQPDSEDWDFGRRVRGYVWRSTEPRASLILQHGFAEYAERYVRRYNRLIPNLNDHGIDVYAFDMSGHGRSAGRRAATDVEDAIEDHLAARRSLAEAKRPLFLLGHSLGGLVTAGSVARDDGLVAGVVLSSPALLFRSTTIQRRIGGVLAKALPGLGTLNSQDPSGLSRVQKEVRLFREDPLIYRGKVPLRLGVTALDAARRGWALYSRWTVPTLTLHGTVDTYTDPKGSALFNALIRSPDKRLEMIPDGRHELLNDVPAHTVLAMVIDWIGRRIDRVELRRTALADGKGEEG